MVTTDYSPVSVETIYQIAVTESRKYLTVRYGLVCFRPVNLFNLFYHLLLWSAVGGYGWSQYENGLDRTAFGVLT